MKGEAAEVKAKAKRSRAKTEKKSSGCQIL